MPETKAASFFDPDAGTEDSGLDGLALLPGDAPFGLALRLTLVFGVATFRAAFFAEAPASAMIIRPYKRIGAYHDTHTRSRMMSLAVRSPPRRQGC